MPGIKDSRCCELCSIFNVSLNPPKKTVCCATTPGKRIECNLTPFNSAPRAPSISSLSLQGVAALVRAAAINSAVRIPVPDGLSSFCGLCASITSTSGKYFAACTANFIINTAPNEKFGAINPPSCFSLASACNSSTCCSKKPLVPITGQAPALSMVCVLLNPADAAVKSTTTCAPVCFINAAKSSPKSQAPTNSNSLSLLTALTASPPIRPFAPFTITLTMLIPLLHL